MKSRPHFTAVRAVPGDICPCLETFLIVTTGEDAMVSSGKSPGTLLDPHSAQDPHSTESLSPYVCDADFERPHARTIFPPILFTSLDNL